MTPEDRRRIEEIAARARLASPSAGRAFFRGRGETKAAEDTVWGFQSKGRPKNYVVAYCHGGGDSVQSMRDAEFLARAREDVLWLMTMVRP